MLNIMRPPAGRQPGDPGVPDFGLIGTILDELRCDELIERLEDYRWTGRPGYAPEVMWRATLVRYLLKLRYTRDLIAQLKASRLLRRVCGLREAVPHEGTFSRFYARLAEHQDLVDAAIAQLAERVGEEIERLRGEGALPDDAPEPGRMVSIDSSDVEAWGKGKTKADAEAKWGHRTAKLAVDGKELFYGYKLHAICDAYHGTPLSWEALPANKNDSPRLPVLMDQLAANHPTLKVRYAIADRGYDALSNYEHLDNSRIFAVIHMRDTDKNGLYTVKGQPRCISGQAMEYVRTDKGKGHLFRCPDDGCQLKGDKPWLGKNCENEHYEGWDGDSGADLRSYLPTHHRNLQVGGTEIPGVPGRRDPGSQLPDCPKASGDDHLVSEKNRLGTAISAVRPGIEAHIAWLEQELNDLDEGLRQTLRRSPVWREKDDLLRTVPGVGERVSLTLLAYLPELGTLDRR